MYVYKWAIPLLKTNEPVVADMGERKKKCAATATTDTTRTRIAMYWGRVLLLLLLHFQGPFSCLNVL